jgi:1,4-dihydroxy-2-naphthoyl-CoA hydrolase
VTYQIDFFDAQFSVYFGVAICQYRSIRNERFVPRKLAQKYKICSQFHSPSNCLIRMGIFKVGVTPEALNIFSKGTLGEHLGIRFTEIGEDYLEATMPVEGRTHQPMGLLHGGASVSLAETLGSVAATLCVDESKFCVGLEINANHLRSVRSGLVKGTTRPIHIGKKTQVWEIRIVNEQNEMVCVSRITMAVLDKKIKED